MWNTPHVHESGAFISRENVLKFAYLTNDINPIHIIDSSAQELGFDRAIAHGMFVTSHVSTALSDCFGEGTVYVSQSVKFIKPVLVDSVIIIKLQNLTTNEKNRFEIETNIWVETTKRRGGEDHKEHQLVAIGKAEIIPGKNGNVPSVYR